MINWANILSWARLASIVPLTVLAHLQLETAFLVVYILAALTDLFDGPIARATGTASPKGADLDGSIDLAFAAAGLWWLWVLFPIVYTTFWPYLLITLASFVLFFAVSQIKIGKPVMPHLLSGKLAMLLFSLLLPIIIFFGIQNWFIHAVWIVATLSRLEMTLFVWKGRTDMDAKSVFFD